MTIIDRYHALRERVSKAEQRREVYDMHIRPYVESKEQQLFEAFCRTSANDLNQLQLIKMQQSVLRGLESSFINDIEDGVIANMELRESGESNV